MPIAESAMEERELILDVGSGAFGTGVDIRLIVVGTILMGFGIFPPTCARSPRPESGTAV